MASVVWPLGQPEKAVFCQSWLEIKWAKLGPQALFSGRPMCELSGATAEDSPIVEARRCERVRARMAAR